jgi:hypothetical protein
MGCPLRPRQFGLDENSAEYLEPNTAGPLRDVRILSGRLPSNNKVGSKRRNSRFDAPLGKRVSDAADLLNGPWVSGGMKRAFVHDAPMGPKNPRSTVLSFEEEAIAVAFRKHTLLPLDDCFYALQATIPHLTRSSLHRCYQRLSRLADMEGIKPARTYPIGYFHIDIAEVRTEEGKLSLFVAVHSKFAFAQLAEKANRVTASAFLTALVEAVPYKIHTVLTDNVLRWERLLARRQQTSIH